MSQFNLNSVNKNNVTSTLLTSLFGCYSNDVVAKSISSYMSKISTEANNLVAGVADACVTEQDIAEYAEKFFNFEYSEPAEWPGEEVRKLCMVNLRDYITAVRAGDSTVICEINDFDDEYQDEVDIEVVTDCLTASNSSLSLMADLVSYLSTTSEDVAARVSGADALFQSKYAIKSGVLSNVYTRVVSMLSNPSNTNFQCIAQAFYDITPHGIKDGEIRNNWTFNDFTCDFSEYTGVNPYAAWASSISVPDLGLFFTRALTAIIETTKNFAVQAVKWIQGVSYKFAVWWQKAIMGESEVWAGIDGVEPSINTGGWQQRISYPVDEEWLQRYPTLWSKLDEHADSPEPMVCLPVMGATLYAWAITTPGGSHRYFVAMRKHIYDNADQIFNAISADGNTITNVADKIESIGGIKPAFATYNDKWSNPVTALNEYVIDKLLKTEKLISFGLLLAAQRSDADFLANRYYQDPNERDEYTYLWMNHPENVNTWTPTYDFLYGQGDKPTVTNAFAIDEACKFNTNTAYRHTQHHLILDALENTLAGTSPSWIPYFWTDKPLTGSISIKTTKQQVEELKDLWVDGVKAIAVVGATVGSLVLYKKLRSAAFLARRQADLLFYDKDVDWRTVMKANKKANLLAKLTGGAATAVESVVPLSFMDDQQTDLETIRTLITG